MAACLDVNQTFSELSLSALAPVKEITSQGQLPMGVGSKLPSRVQFLTPKYEDNRCLAM